MRSARAALVIVLFAIYGVDCSSEDCDPDVDRAHCDDEDGYLQCLGSAEEDDYRWVRAACLGDYRCVDDPAAPVLGCVFGGAPYPACDGVQGFTCEGDLAVSCSSGYRREHYLCIGCTVTGSRPDCTSFFQGACSSSVECPPGLECRPVYGKMLCSRACSCEDDSIPPSCEECVDLGFPTWCTSEGSCYHHI